MNNSKMVFSLDIGSSKIVALVGYVNANNIEVHGVGTYYFTNNNYGNDFIGMNCGIVCDIGLISKLVNQVLTAAKLNADCSSGSVIVNIAGSKIHNLIHKKQLNINGEIITAEIIKNLIDISTQNVVPNNCALLDYEIQEYLIDNTYYTINPCYLTANIVESNLNLFLANSSQINNIKKIISLSDFTLSKIIPSSILSGIIVTNREEKELGCCVIDIGANTSDVIVYENGFIRFLISYPFGGESITHDLASVLKLTRNLAEDIKLNYGTCLFSSNIAEKINMTNNYGEQIVLSKRIIIEIITERLKEIFYFIKLDLEKHNLLSIINSGIILTGGTALLNNINTFTNQIFNLPVRTGIPNYNGNLTEMINGPQYATSLGALMFAKEYMLQDLNNNTFKNYTQCVLNFFKKYI